MSAAKVEIAKHLNITDLGKACTFVGLQISRNHPERSITIHQTSYITRVLERFGMLDSRVVHTTLNPSVMLTPSTEEELSSPDFPYTAVGFSHVRCGHNPSQYLSCRPMSFPIHIQILPDPYHCS